MTAPVVPRFDLHRTHSLNDYKDEKYPYEVAGDIIEQPITALYDRTESIRFYHNGHFGIRADRALLQCNRIKLESVDIPPSLTPVFEVWLKWPESCTEHQIKGKIPCDSQNKLIRERCEAEAAYVAAFAILVSRFGLSKTSPESSALRNPTPVKQEESSQSPSKLRKILAEAGLDLEGFTLETIEELGSLYILELRPVKDNIWQPVVYRAHSRLSLAEIAEECGSIGRNGR